MFLCLLYIHILSFFSESKNDEIFNFDAIKVSQLPDFSKFRGFRIHGFTTNFDFDTFLIFFKVRYTFKIFLYPFIYLESSKFSQMG